VTGLGDTSSATSLIPGSPDQLQDDARIWRRRAASYDELDSGLGALDLQTGWRGPAGDAAHALLDATRRVWRGAAQAHRAAAGQLEAFAEVLREAQSDARRAIGMHADAEHATSRARQAYERAATDAAGIAAPLAQPSIWLAEQFIDPGAGERQRAQVLLDAARQRVQDAGDRAAHSLISAADSAKAVRSILAASAADARYPSDLATLGLLAGMSAARLKKFMADHPSLAQEFWTDRPDASAVSAWWNGLTAAERRRMIQDAPTIVGNLNGVPYHDRDDANRVALEAAANASHLTKDQKDAIANIRSALTGRKGGGQRYLIDFDLAAVPPLAAVSIGDVDTADDVTVDVPGMATYTASSMSSWTDAAQNLFRRQGYVDPNHSHAVVAWIGYNAPPFDISAANKHAADSVMSNVRAQQGAPRLAADIDGILDTRSGEAASTPRVAVVAHSYGTTTTAYALTQTAHDVNAVDFVASAGIDHQVIPDASALHVAATNGHEQVYASQATRDFVATTGRVGSGRSDPEDAGFGAITYSSDGGKAPDGTVYAAVNGHDTLGSGPALPPYSVGTGHGYFDLGTESLQNIAVVSTGHGTLLSGLAPQVF
jgi:hypothetical protein